MKKIMTVLPYRILKNINLQNLKRASAFIDIGNICLFAYINNLEKDNSASIKIVHNMLVNQFMATLGVNPLEPNKFIWKFSMKIPKKCTVGLKFNLKMQKRTVKYVRALAGN